MRIELSVANFKSIEDEVRLSLTDSKVPDAQHGYEKCLPIPRSAMRPA